MTLSIDEMEYEEAWLDEWPIAPRPRFLSSPALETLKRDLWQYVTQQVSGRSYLISGHRGAGKTALAWRAVDDVYRRVIRQLHYDSTKRPIPQRPLFVRIHGPSLLEPLPKPAANGNDGDDDGSGDGGERASPKPKWTSDFTNAPKSPSDVAHGALVHVTISLYRALASEIARTFTIHAREQHRLHADEQLELAAQLILQLDLAPDPATLRAFWARLRRLGPGILWPRSADAIFDAFGFGNQGVREIVAVAAAAQAYQVCTGAVTFKEIKKDSKTREDVRESKADLNPKGLISAVTGILIGTGAAVAAVVLNQGPVAALASGLTTGLITTVTVNWTSKRSRKSQTGIDYSFIRDRSVATLERDLPLVIQRVRDAGLAPVFVVDELDKLSDPRVSIAGIINRLKHLTTDYGFFCFLTDRDYYEAIQQKVHDEAYPMEHTYFSHWLFVLYKPEEFVTHLQGIIQSDQPPGSPERDTDELARLALALVIAHRAKLNPSDMIREIGRLCDVSGKVRLEPKDLTSQPQFRLAASLQLAIQHVLRGSAVTTRMQNDPLFAQLAVDAVYLISRAWENDRREVELGRNDIVSYLLRRMRLEVPVDRQKAEKALINAVGRVELDILIRLVGDLANLLADFKQLHEGIAGLFGEAAAKLVPLDLKGLLNHVTGRTYEFTYDSHGGDIETSKRVKAAEQKAAEKERVPLADTIPEDIDKSLEFVNELEGALQQLKLDFADLVAVKLLPETVPWSRALNARTRLQEARKSNQAYGEIEVDVPILQSLPGAVARNGAALVASIALAREISRDVGCPLKDALTKIARYLDFGRLAQISNPHEVFADVTLPEAILARIPSLSLNNSADLRHWRAGLNDEPKEGSK